MSADLWNTIVQNQGRLREKNWREREGERESKSGQGQKIDMTGDNVINDLFKILFISITNPENKNKKRPGLDN